MSTELSTDISVITAEINAYKRIAGEAIFEIGRRLKHVKEHDLVHGEWERWCRSELEMDRTVAFRFIKVFEVLSGSNVATGQHIGVKALYEIATLPPEAREVPHTVPSSGESKRPDEMTVRELREVKAALKLAESERQDALERAQKAEADYEVVRDTLESMPPPRAAPDPEMASRLKRYETRYGDIDGVVTDHITNHAEIDGAAAHFADSVQTLLIEYAHLTTYKATINEIGEYQANKLNRLLLDGKGADFLAFVNRKIREVAA